MKMNMFNIFNFEYINAYVFVYIPYCIPCIIMFCTLTSLTSGCCVFITFACMCTVSYMCCEYSNSIQKPCDFLFSMVITVG